ncbi:hypothetical protein [Paraferrimonas sedimenticola]|uniref:Lipoprotein n=1 Tax=Paraferrimonas sedimenticola TaxID=375674 RepID=A0AA37RUX6_9GAMM|nr:hypothetical protein [Paraferrimonas sedimenticola]GLP95002.1 hypothetical protein GCM10007895_03080 [Paraferrimonas sedimenticola]
MRHRLFATFVALTLLSGCISTTAMRGLKSGGTTGLDARILYKAKDNCPEYKVVISEGKLSYFGQHNYYWPEELSLCIGELKKVKFYEKFQPNKLNNNSLELFVYLADGTLVFDANPNNPNIINYGARIFLNLEPKQIERNISTLENFSTSMARNISITIYSPNYKELSR